MKQLLLFSALILSFTAHSQYSNVHYDPDHSYQLAKDYIFKKQFLLAYPLLNELETSYQQKTGNSTVAIKEDVHYYYITTGLLLNKSIFSVQAEEYIEDVSHQERTSSMAYYLGHYYFINNDYTKAILYFNKSGYNNLENEEIAELKFELAYAYFYLKNYEKAKPLFNEIQQLPGNKYYLPSNYYYGFIAYRDKEYDPALRSFRIVEKLPQYAGIVPYYIAEIYYFNNDKVGALAYAEKGLSNPNLYYKKELQLLSGQIYFEDKLFEKALPFLESYVAASAKVSKEVLYELSFCYYSINNNQKAIEGFKQLSSENDSLGQNSMYLLGDLYLRLYDKVNARNAFQFSANNSSNLNQQEISRFTFAKLSYELGYSDIALTSIQKYIATYPNSSNIPEAKEVMINLLAKSNNFKEALNIYQELGSPSNQLQKVFPRLLFGRASELMAEQRIMEARDLFIKAIDQPYSNSIMPFANFWLAEIAYRLDKYDESINKINLYFQTAGTQGEANPVSANYLLGYDYLKKINYQQALSFFKLASTGISATSPTIIQDAFLRTGDCNFMLKNYTVAKSIYNQVINFGFSSSDYAIYQIALIAGINNPDEKIKELLLLESKFPTSELVEDANLEIANSYMASEKFKEAIPYLSKILSSTTNQYKPKALLKLGLAWYNLDDNTNALKNYIRLVDEYPQSNESDQALINLKSIYLENGHTDEYIAILKKAGKAISTYEEDSLSFSSANSKFISNDCIAAISAFNNYLTKFPSGSFTVEADYYKSECYIKQKDFKNAIGGLETVAASNNKLAVKSSLELARIYYLELTDYQKAKNYFSRLKEIAVTPEDQLEALRGLVRSYYQTKDFNQASEVARELLSKKNISTDDRSIANLVLGKSLESAKKFEEAIIAFKVVTAINKSVWGAEARYEIANSYFQLNNLSLAERSAMEVIKVNASSDLWIARSYILLGDIYMLQKDYFNAKATYQSVATNASIPEIKAEAQQKLDIAITSEQSNSKIVK